MILKQFKLLNFSTLTPNICFIILQSQTKISVKSFSHEQSSCQILDKYRQVIIQFSPFIIKINMQPNQENQLFIFEDDESIVEAPAPRKKSEDENNIENEIIEENKQLAQEVSHHEQEEQLISPNFNSTPSHLKVQQGNHEQIHSTEQKQSKDPNLVFLQQNAYSFRPNNLGQEKKSRPQSITNQMDVISDFNSQVEKNETLIQEQEEITSGISRKNRRNKSKSRFQDINDDSSVKSSKLVDKAQHFKEPSTMVPNLMTPARQKEDEYHRTQDHLRHDKNDHTEIIESITAVQKSKKNEKELPPIKQKPGQIFINTSGILQNESSMVAIHQKQGINKLSMANMSSLTQMINTSQFDKAKKIAEKIVPLSRTFKCQFKRQKKCCISYWHPQYSIYFKNEQLILNAKKQCGHINSRYNITSQEKDFNKESEGFLGYLAGNFIGTCFNLYQQVEDKEELICTIIYGTELKCSSTCRNIEVFIKNQEFPTESLFQGDQKGLNLRQLYDLGENAKQRKIFKLINKQPYWNQELGCYSLNFKGKCRMGSVKNSIFVSEEEPSRYVLLFCKTDENAFHAQISYPLSPFIAMGIILSSFDFKLFCQ